MVKVWLKGYDMTLVAVVCKCNDFANCLVDALGILLERKKYLNFMSLEYLENTHK